MTQNRIPVVIHADADTRIAIRRNGDAVVSNAIMTTGDQIVDGASIRIGSDLLENGQDPIGRSDFPLSAEIVAGDDGWIAVSLKQPAALRIAA